MKPILKYLIIGLVVFLLVCIPVVYYFDRLEGFTKDPSKVLHLFFKASGLGAFSLNFILVNLGIFLTAALVDLCVLGWQKSALKKLAIRPSATARGDLWCWILSVLSLYDFVALLFSLGLFYVLSSIIVKSGGWQPIQLLPFAWLQFLILVFLDDFKHYLWHRFMHGKTFWELHKYHHSATEFNLITTARGHFLEKGVLLVFDSILFSLLGAPVEQFVLFLILKEFYSQLLHSEILSSLGVFGKYLFVSPTAHRLHHSDKTEHYNRNFGNMFIFWDKLFGTYACTDDKITIGVNDNPYNIHGFWWDMKECTRAFIREFTKSAGRNVSSANKVPAKIIYYFKNGAS